MHKRGIVFLGDCNVGKSSKLYEIFQKSIKNGKKVLIVDSATEHVEKSLLMRVIKSNIINYTLIKTCKKEMIVFPYATKGEYPQEIINKTNSQVYLCDAAYYLERSYDLPVGQRREEERAWYKRFCMQVIEILLHKVDVIILDEIELLPSSNRVLEAVMNRQIELYIALHTEESLRNMESFFDIKKL